MSIRDRVRQWLGFEEIEDVVMSTNSIVLRNHELLLAIKAQTEPIVVSAKSQPVRIPAATTWDWDSVQADAMKAFENDPKKGN